MHKFLSRTHVIYDYFLLVLSSSPVSTLLTTIVISLNSGPPSVSPQNTIPINPLVTLVSSMVGSKNRVKQSWDKAAISEKGGTKTVSQEELCKLFDHIRCVYGGMYGCLCLNVCLHVNLIVCVIFKQFR